MIDMLNPEHRTQSRAICDAATNGDSWATNHPGVWYLEVKDIGYVIYADDGEGRTEICSAHYNDDAVFIAHARTALPAALDALEVLETRADAAEGDAKHWEQRAEDATNKAAKYLRILNEMYVKLRSHDIQADLQVMGDEAVERFIDDYLADRL